MAMARRAGVPQKDKAQTHYVSKAGALSSAASSTTTTWRNSWQLAASCNPQRPAAEGAHQRAAKKPAQIEGRYARSLGPVWDRVNNPHSVQGTARRRRQATANGEATRAAARMPCPWWFTILGASHTTDWQTRRQTRTLSVFFPSPARGIMDHGSCPGSPGASIGTPCTSPICTSSQRRGSSPPPPSLVDAVSR
jgi:hypothetical protein